MDEAIRKEISSDATKNLIKASDVMSFRAIVPTQLIVSPIELTNSMRNNAEVCTNEGTGTYRLNDSIETKNMRG